MLDMMRWPYPGPVTGSIYDQDPILMDKFAIIASRKSAYQEQERKRSERSSGPKKPLSQRKGK